MKEETIELLRKDMMGEHQAIVQYLLHAYAMGEGEIACEIEAIAREEMRHLDWLADAIAELGGDPTMARDPVDTSPGTPEEQMLKDVNLEQVAIDQYRAHLEAIDDPKIRRTLARILHDEMVHKEQFADLAEEARQEAVPESASPTAALPQRVAEILNQGIRHEYTVTLQYLFHSFVTPHKELAEEMQNIAINEMQHLGWLAEELADSGGEPHITHTDLVLTRDHQEMLEADIAVEREVTQAYSEQIPELEDEGLRKLVTRIRDHELHHDAVFGDLLEEIKEEEEQAAAPDTEEPGKASPPAIPSVGSLIDR